MTRALEGVRVLDFCFPHTSGSYCTSLLADMGAEVIRVDRPIKSAAELSYAQEMLVTTGRNKKSITLNLRAEKGKEILTRLVKQSDVIVSVYLSNMAKRLGVDYETVERINTNIVYCSITGYGQDGPYSNRPSHGIDCYGVSGVFSLPGSYVTPPSNPGIPVSVLAGDLFGFASILAALLARPKIGHGQFIDIGTADVLFSWAALRGAGYMLKGTMPKLEERVYISPISDVFDTKDGKKIVLGLLEDRLWRNFCDAAGRRDLAEDERFSTDSKRKENWKETYDTLQEVTLSKTRDEWNEILTNKEIAFSPVNELDEAFNDPQFNYRGLIQEMDYPGVGKIKQVAFPAKFSQTPADIRTSPSSPGQDTDEILQTLGYSLEEIADFRQIGVI